MARKIAHLVAALAATACTSAFALGLGAIESRSALNQPLSARIPLHAVQPDELRTVSVELAPSEAFDRAGVDRPFFLSNLAFEVVGGDRPYIRVTSSEPIKEPFLDFLVEVNWASGRMVREYTLLLDPPVYADEPSAAPATAASGRGVGSGVERGTRGATASPSRPEPRWTTEPEPAPAAPTAAVVSGQYRVNDGDSLWRIAERARPDGSIDVHQAMLAIARANPEAFIEGDINRLRRGSILRVPEGSEMAEVSRQNAFREIQRMLAEHRRPEPESVAAAESEPTPETPAQSRDASAAADGHLRVVAATDADLAVDGGSLVDAELNPTQESVERLQRELGMMRESELSLQSENEDLRRQVDGLRQELENLERLLNLQMEQQQTAQVPVPDLSIADEEAPVAGEEVAAEVASEATEAADAQTVAEVAEASSRPAVAPALPLEEPEEPGLLQDMRTMGMAVGTGLLLGLLGWLVVRRRRLAAAAPVSIQFDDDATGTRSPKLKSRTLTRPMSQRIMTRSPRRMPT
ncbi:hypothetical protein CAI21_02635 [Alkalilimnicola ehrlichii]|uniref:FimV N-terminal domain-containing protein n=1 Tax=Alkalilimnicola ehrlichii TaxID=351052 RepID=A0A3E0X2Z5_9GAMM|nr:FimV/HubP family polar landmark protein [Alkalilimnicola ehrlichii]RFA30896.1 hypothetical protein CAI21_02635 [Alkalilimnicola ehrlichii]RFA38846.1 hypothetical protein CAL65_02780 [Alkalilimnicola ehrlichii]